MLNKFSVGERGCRAGACGGHGLQGGGKCAGRGQAPPLQYDVGRFAYRFVYLQVGGAGPRSLLS